MPVSAERYDGDGSARVMQDVMVGDQRAVRQIERRVGARHLVAVRTGHHCAQPVMQRFGIPATTRASLAFYNTRQEIDALVTGLHKVAEIFG